MRGRCDWRSYERYLVTSTSFFLKIFTSMLHTYISCLFSHLLKTLANQEWGRLLTNNNASMFSSSASANHFPCKYDLSNGKKKSRGAKYGKYGGCTIFLNPTKSISNWVSREVWLGALSWWNTYEPRHDKTNKVSVRPAKTPISLGIRPVWSESSLFAWRKLGSLVTHWAHSEDSDQNGRIPRLIWVFAGHTATLLVLSCRCSYNVFNIRSQFWSLFPYRIHQVMVNNL